MGSSKPQLRGPKDDQQRKKSWSPNGPHPTCGGKNARSKGDSPIEELTSDNVPTFTGSSGGLNGGKYTTMEGGHRVPAIFRWPSKVPRGVVSDVTLTSMDLLPLCCEISGTEPPADRIIDGKNILPILQGEESKSPHEFTYYYNGTNLQAIRRVDFSRV